jgi:hypothetical protein
MRRAGETANGRTGEARFRAAGSKNLRRFRRQGGRLDLRGVAVSPIRRFAHSPPGSWLL